MTTHLYERMSAVLLSACKRLLTKVLTVGNNGPKTTRYTRIVRYRFRRKTHLGHVSLRPQAK